MLGRGQGTFRTQDRWGRGLGTVLSLNIYNKFYKKNIFNIKNYMYLCIIKYTQLTEASLKQFMKDLSFKSEPKREYVMMTGLSGMFLFDFAMRGIELPNGIKHNWVKFKKLPNVLYINIGKKHDNTKIKVDMYNKTYTAMLGTIVLGTTNDVNKTVKLFNL